MRRKRRNRGTWLPMLGHLEGDSEPFAYADHVIFANVDTQVAKNGELGPAIAGPFPLLPDFTQEEAGAVAGASLRDRVEGQSWLLQRLVGKVHLGCVPSPSGDTNPDNTWSAIYLVAGILVARSDDNAQTVCDLTAREANPTHVDNIDNPWVWRRSWILSNPRMQNNVASIPNTWDSPSSYTGSRGGVLDGAHIDSKVKRVILKEHRLWFVIAARGWDGTQLSVLGNDETQPAFAGIIDLRAYGALVRGHKTSSF